MRRTILFYGLSLAILVAVLKFIEYRYLVRDFSLEFYVAAVAMLFTGLGVWVGLKLTRRKTVVLNPNFKLNELEIRRLGISPRELEVLELVAAGHSNQEIADKLFVSLNTVKTHASSIFLKLNVSRRTQAIQKAKELQFIP